MDNQYNFAVCKELCISCIATGFCQLNGIEEGIRCDTIRRFIDLLTPNGFTLGNLPKQINCPSSGNLISLFLCFKTQHCFPQRCQNCQERLRKILLNIDLFQLVEKVTRELEEKRKSTKFTITSNNDNHQKSNLPGRFEND